MKIQSDVYTIILITILLAFAIIAISKKLDKTDPFAKPKGIIVPVILGVESVYRMCSDNLGQKLADHYVPYILVLWVYIFVSNIISLFG